MSQNGTTPTTIIDENRPPSATTTIPTPVFVPLMPMFFPYANTGAHGQQFYSPSVHPNMQAYPSANAHRYGNFGVGYNPYYPSFYVQSNSILPSTAHMDNSAALLPAQSTMPHSLMPIQRSSSAIITNHVERNKNLNIHECKSPELTNRKQEKLPLQIVDSNDTNVNSKNREDSLSTSSATSHTGSDQNPVVPSSRSFIQEIESDNSQDDFLTFIEQKTKANLTTTTSMPELNPYAHEFSFGHNTTLTNDLTLPTNGIDHQQEETNQPDSSSFRLLIDNLIEKSLESIDAIKNSTKKVPTNDACTQHNQNPDCLNRSTQTTENSTNNQLLDEYSLRTMNSIDKLLNNFQNIYHYEYHDQYKIMAHTCDELRHLVLLIRYIVGSSSNNVSIDFNNPFSEMIENFQVNNKHFNVDRTSHVTYDCGRGTRRLITSANTYSPVPSFSCRQIDPVVISAPQLCLLCRRPLDNNDNLDDTMHEICRTLITRPNRSINA